MSRSKALIVMVNHRAWSTCAATPEYLQNYSATRVQTGDIVRVFADALRETSALTSAQHVVLVALARCRTAALGGHLAVCDTCGHATPVDHSCRNRHCPTCQSLDQHRWLEAHHKRVLPTRYFHVVFTLPEVCGRSSSELRTGPDGSCGVQGIPESSW